MLADYKTEMRREASARPNNNGSSPDTRNTTGVRRTFSVLAQGRSSALYLESEKCPSAIASDASIITAVKYAG
jgi:hypothetical protein